MKKLAVLFLAVLAAAVRANAQDNPNANSAADGPHGPPADWVATPPLHGHPDLTTGPSGYSPVQIRHAYGVDKITGNGAGQVIAIVDAYGSSTIQSDLNTFSSTYGLPQTTIKFVYPQGSKFTPSSSTWALETALDVEWAHAIAPGATIVLVVTKSAGQSDLLGGVDAAVASGARQISLSWGGAEFSGEATYDTHFNKAGVTFTVASGDNGSGVQWPAASPYVTSVGGTTLSLDVYGNVTSETAWSGSGGGVSKYEARPSYQNNWQTGAGRGVPDVSFDANPSTGFPVYIGNYNGAKGWITVGGTSAGAPQWAAIMAIANAQRSTPVNGADVALYTMAGTGYSTFFRDVTVGNNGGYSATPRYDYVTGLGSPIANQIVAGLKVY